MNKRIQELAEKCKIEIHGVNGELLASDFDAEQFARSLVGELVAKMRVDGSEFYYNEFNDYGCVTVKFFTGAGNPADTMCGEEIIATYQGGKVRGTGYYHLNSAFVDYLLGALECTNEF